MKFKNKLYICSVECKRYHNLIKIPLLSALHHFFEGFCIMEIWKEVKNYPNYQVSNQGNVKSLKTLKNISKTKDSNGYFRLKLSKNGSYKTIRIHQLVAIAFLNHTPDGFKTVVNHKDFNNQNNCVENLELVSNRINCNKKHLKSSSEYTGVSWVKSRNKWLAQILINGTLKNLGRFTNEYDAHLAYEKALLEL